MVRSQSPHWFRSFLVVLVGVSIMLAVGCGDDDDSTESEPARDPVSVESLNGKTFNSIEVKGHELVDGTTITLSFGPGALTASAGCNSIRGAIEVNKGAFSLGKAAGTLLGCPGDLQAQDEWLTSVLDTGLRPYDDDGNLLLLGLGVEITMKEGIVPGGRPPIVGTTWELNSYDDGGGIVTSVKPGVRLPFLRFKENRTVDLFDGCNDRKGLAEVKDDGTISFTLVGRTTLKACPGITRDVSRTILKVLDGEASYAFEGQNLVLARAGSSLTYTPG